MSIRIPWNKGLKGFGKWPKTKGFKHSEKTKLQMSKKRKGKKIGPFSIEAKKNMSISHIGLKHSIEHRKNISKSLKGDKAPNWKGGISPVNHIIRGSVEYRLWREAVFKRDDYTCIWCRQKGGKLNADHIKKFSDYPELRFAIDNGRTLCEECHKKTDTFKNKKKR